MKITVKLFATFRNGRFKEEEREVPDGATLRQVVVDVGIVEREIGMSLINGCHAPLEQALKDGDNIFLFPMLTGG